MKRLHPNDWVAIVSIAYDLCTGIPALLLGFIWLGVAIIIGGVALVALFDWWEDRFYRQGAIISWLDYMRVRDLMAHGQNYEAVIFTLRKGYNMTEAEVKRLSPDELDTLLQKLKVRQNASG
jgi:hypothetical protein